MPGVGNDLTASRRIPSYVRLEQWSQRFFAVYDGVTHPDGTLDMMASVHCAMEQAEAAGLVHAPGMLMLASPPLAIGPASRSGTVTRPRSEPSEGSEPSSPTEADSVSPQTAAPAAADLWIEVLPPARRTANVRMVSGEVLGRDLDFARGPRLAGLRDDVAELVFWGQELERDLIRLFIGLEQTRCVTSLRPEDLLPALERPADVVPLTVYGLLERGALIEGFEVETERAYLLGGVSF